MSAICLPRFRQCKYSDLGTAMIADDCSSESRACLFHFMVIIKPSSPIYLNQAVVFFQPKDPESIQVALAALSGGVVPGLLCMRTMTMLPKRKCWLIGVCEGDAVSRAKAFNEDWETDLRIGQHDCREYTDGLIEYLTGKKQALKHIKGTFDSSK